MSSEPLAMNVDQLLTTTRNVRKRLDSSRPVSRAVVQECLELALQAPNGSNHQRWEWIVLDDQDVRRQVAELCREGFAHYIELIAARPDIYENFDMGRNRRRVQIWAAAHQLMDTLHEIPVFVIPTIRGRTDRANVFTQASMWGSILPATWSFMLALRSRGLGSCLTTTHLWKEREVAEVLGLPFEEYTQAALLPVAYTTGTHFKPAQRRPAADVLHWNHW